MLTERLERDVTQHHHFVVAADFLEGPAQVIGRIGFIAGKPVLVGLHHPLRGIEHALALRVLSGPTQQGTHRLLGSLA